MLQAPADLVVRVADETPVLADACMLLSRPTTSDEAQVALARILVLAAERYGSVSCPWVRDAHAPRRVLTPACHSLLRRRVWRDSCRAWRAPTDMATTCLCPRWRPRAPWARCGLCDTCARGAHARARAHLQVLACALGFKHDGASGDGGARVSTESVAALLSSAGVSASASLGECARMMAQCVASTSGGTPGVRDCRARVTDARERAGGRAGSGARARLEAGTVALLGALALLRHPGAGACLREVVRWAASGDTALVGAAARCVEVRACGARFSRSSALLTQLVTAQALVHDVDAARIARLDAAFAGLTSCFVKNAASCAWDAGAAVLSPVRAAVTALARAYGVAQTCSATAAAELAAIVGEPLGASAAGWHIGAADAPERVVERVRAALVDDTARARVVDACDAVCAAIGLAPCVPFA